MQDSELHNTISQARQYSDRQISSFLLCTLALSGAFLCYWLLNFTAFPLFDPIYHWTRELSAIIGGLALTIVAFISYWNTKLFTYQRTLMVSLGFLIVGVAGTLGGLTLKAQILLVLGASLLTVGIGFANILVGIGSSHLSLRQLGLSVTSAYVFTYALRGTFSVIPSEFNLALFCAMPFVMIFLVARFVRPILNHDAQSQSAAQMAQIAPTSMLPFSNRLFITLLLFRFIYGFTLTFSENNRVPLLVMTALIPLAIFLVFVCAQRTPLNPDRLFKLSIVCSIAGFLLLTIPGVATEPISLLLSCGTGFFEILLYFVLIALGSKNSTSALPMLAWGNAMASWGTLLGANFGRLANDAASNQTFTSASLAIIIFVLVIYVVFENGFSFSATVRGITAPPSIVLLDDHGQAQSIEQRCGVLGITYDLTDREQEIFELLARGRNIRYIEKELMVSYNTVKTHVSHIYAKLGVHSHQELINLVEQGSNASSQEHGDRLC